MTTTSIAKIGNYVDQEVTLEGWLYNKRSSGKIQFLQVRDGTSLIQCVVVKADVQADVFETCATLSQESSVRISGMVREDHRAPSGYELTVTKLTIVQQADEYPITHKEHGVDFLLDHRHLWIRVPRQRALLRIRAEVERAFANFLHDEEFTRVDPPILTPSSCEDSTELFETNYFDQVAYLTQSGQMYMEAVAMALGKVYSLGPAFRAEKSKTRRHLIEFWMLEPEMAYYQHEDNLRLQESLLIHVVQHVLHSCEAELELLGRDVKRLEKVVSPFPRMTYDEALKWLNGRGFDLTWGDDFGSPHETALAAEYDAPLFVERYPTQLKAFYMQPDLDRPEVALCADLLAPEGYGEIIGGSERIHDFSLLKQRFEEHGLSEETYGWYLDLRRYGSVPHSGFGLGIERTVAWISGIEHVRESIAFPRMLYRLQP